MPTIQDQNFGVEVEVAGAARHVIAQAVVDATGGAITGSHQTTYDSTIVTDLLGRSWKIVNDSSIAVINGHRGSEVVSPILTYTDIPLLQEVVRSVKRCGAIAHSSTSVHIHVDARPHSPQTLANLAKMVYKNEDLIFDALKVNPDRRARYTRPMEDDFISKIAGHKPESDRRLNEYWYGRYNATPEHYHNSRYHGLNFNNCWRAIGTLEFRYFNGTLHAGKIKSYVQLCLALSVKALNSRAASHKKIATDNPKFNFRVWLVATLGMKGDEFKTARYHLTHDLPGNSAWRHGPPNHANNQSRIEE